MGKRIAFQFSDDLEYQLQAIQSTVSLFKGLSRHVDGIYRPTHINIPGLENPVRNTDIVVGSRLLSNLRNIQLSNGLFADSTLYDGNNFTIEMETGERVIIVTGCINALGSRVSETFIKNFT